MWEQDWYRLLGVSSEDERRVTLPLDTKVWNMGSNQIKLLVS